MDFTSGKLSWLCMGLCGTVCVFIVNIRSCKYSVVVFSVFSVLPSQYFFFYSLWIPLGTLWTLHNVKAWEGSREKAVTALASGDELSDEERTNREFFMPAYEQLEDLNLESKVRTNLGHCFLCQPTNNLKI